MSFKVHMVLFSDEESFSTLCGIDDGCSERFYENCGRYLVEFGNDKKTTCKKCLSRFKRMVAKQDAEVAALAIPAQLPAFRSHARLGLVYGRRQLSRTTGKCFQASTNMKKETQHLKSGDAVKTASGVKYFSHFTDPRVLINAAGLTWDAITMNFLCGYRETADYRGLIEVSA